MRHPSPPGTGEVNQQRVVYATHVVRERAHGEDHVDFEPHVWVSLDIPMGPLARVAPTGGSRFGDDEQSLRWRRPVDNWLVGIAERVYRSVPFRLALVGMEVSGDGHDAFPEPPADRAYGYLLPVGSSLRYFPAAT